MAGKVGKLALVLAALYVVGGIGLLALGRLDRLYFWPGWSIKGPNSKTDRSGFAADGPVVYFHGDALISRRIAPRHGALALLTDTLQPCAVLTCFVAETGQTFRVPLRRAVSVPASAYPQPEKWVAVSDIEGNFKGFEQLLRGAGVVDAQLTWRFGRGHLVLVGDFFDRGLQVTECLWLIYKLEQEAEQAGGKIHFIMGNHERMNLTGHFRYVRRKYRVSADTLGVAYAQWYGRATVLGQWLRTKNVVEKIGSLVFVHGGISPELTAQGLSLAQLNDWARTSLDTPAVALPPQARLATQPPSSPDWYRDLALEKLTEAQVAQVLKTYGATAMVIGHTPVMSIKPLYHGKVIAIDLPHQKRTDESLPLQALWLEKGRMSVIDGNGHKSAF